jgi:GGDEF domain-containing protein
MAQAEALELLYLQAPCQVETSDNDQIKHLAVTIGDNISSALANIRLRGTLGRQVIHDFLTGLSNWRCLDETLEREIR